MQEQLEERSREQTPHTGEERPPVTKERPLSNRRARVWGEERPWPIRVLTWLLALQGLLLALLGLFNMQGEGTVLMRVAEQPLYAAVVPLSVMALIAVIGFLQLRPGAWVVAMLLQGLMLLMALIAYFSQPLDDAVIYAMLFYGVVMVLYLNYAEVPLLFRVQPGDVLPEAEEEEIL